MPMLRELGRYPGFWCSFGLFLLTEGLLGTHVGWGVAVVLLAPLLLVTAILGAMFDYAYDLITGKATFADIRANYDHHKETLK